MNRRAVWRLAEKLAALVWPRARPARRRLLRWLTTRPGFMQRSTAGTHCPVRRPRTGMKARCGRRFCLPKATPAPGQRGNWPTLLRCGCSAPKARCPAAGPATRGWPVSRCMMRLYRCRRAAPEPVNCPPGWHGVSARCLAYRLLKHWFPPAVCSRRKALTAWPGMQIPAQGMRPAAGWTFPANGCCLSMIF